METFWVAFFSSTYFCGGCLLAFFAAAMKARQFARSAMLAVLCGVYAFVFYQGWIQDADSRLSMLVVVPISFCFGAVLAGCKQFSKRETLQKVIVVFAMIMGVFSGGLDALLASPSFREWDTVEQTATSPDGRYQAVRVDRESMMTYGHEIITIRPTYFSVFNILDYPNIQITQVVPKRLTDVRWSSQRTLVVEYYSDAIFEQQDKAWRDVKIIYKNEGRLRKNEGVYQ